MIRQLVFVAAVLFALGECIMRAPEFVLDLDKAPTERWNGAVEAVVGAHGWENSFGAVISLYGPAFDVVNRLLPEVPIALEKHLATNYPENYGEIQGIAKSFAALNHSEVNTTLLSALTFFYEVAHTNELVASKTVPASLYKACTGILSLPVDKTKPTIHGRNMDESPPQGRNCTLSINVTKNGVLQYQMFDWMWVTSGVYTASRIGGVTLEMNWRNHNNAQHTLTEIIDKILNMTHAPIQLAFRDIMAKQLDFDETVQYLSTNSYAAPFYVISSGTKRRGAVFAISYNNSENRIAFLNDTSPYAYLVQTNYDRWKPDPPRDPRRTVAQDTLNDLGRYRSGTHLGVFQTLSTYPVHNPNTMFSVLMSTEEALDGYIRRAMIPDPDA